jgi:GntR family transcriptional regulator
VTGGEWRPILREFGRRLAPEHRRAGHSIWQADLGERDMHVETVVIFNVDADHVPDYVSQGVGADRYLVREREFTVEGRCVQLATSYLDMGLVAGTAIERADTGPGGTYARLEEIGAEPRRFQEDAVVRRPSADEHEQLDLDDLGVVVEIVRIAKDETGRVVEITRMVLAASAYVLRSTLAV